MCQHHLLFHSAQVILTYKLCSSDGIFVPCGGGWIRAVAVEEKANQDENESVLHDSNLKMII